MTWIRRIALLGALAVVAVSIQTGPRFGDALFADQPETRPSTPAPGQAALSKTFRSQTFQQAYARHRLEEGMPFARLRIPRFNVDLIVVEGVSGDALRAGAGHYPESAFPGAIGNVAIAGHRTGFGAPFLRLDEMERGDIVILETPDGVFRYEVAPAFDGHANPWVAQPLDWTVIAPVDGRVLTLTTAHPPRTAKNRLVVRLRLVSDAASSG